METPPERTEQQQRPKKSEQDGAAAAAVPPSTAAVPALESRKQEQNLLVRIASGEDTLLLKKEILEHTEQHGPLERAGLAAALQAGAAARGAGSAAAAAPVPAATGLMDPTGDSYVQECMTHDPDSPSMDVIGWGSGAIKAEPGIGALVLLYRA